MANRKVTIAVDRKFFDNIFETKRKELQKQLGVINLSQANFSKMIKGIKVVPLKKDLFNVKIKKLKRRKNDLFKI